MDRPPPDFDLLIELLQHSDHNYNYFAASKLQSVLTLLQAAHQPELVSELVYRLKQLRTPEFWGRCDEETLGVIDEVIRKKGEATGQGVREGTGEGGP